MRVQQSALPSLKTRKGCKLDAGLLQILRGFLVVAKGKTRLLNSPKKGMVTAVATHRPMSLKTLARNQPRSRSRKRLSLPLRTIRSLSPQQPRQAPRSSRRPLRVHPQINQNPLTRSSRPSSTPLSLLPSPRQRKICPLLLSRPRRLRRHRPLAHHLPHWKPRPLPQSQPTMTNGVVSCPPTSPSSMTKSQLLLQRHRPRPLATKMRVIPPRVRRVLVKIYRVLQ